MGAVFRGDLAGADAGMKRISRFYRWPWKPAHVEDEVDDELALHVEMRTREFIERGVDPAEARRLAETKLGDVDRVRAECRTIAEGRDRDMRRTEFFDELGQDVRFAGRQLMRNPGFTLVAILTLALGIGGTTAIFSAVYAVVLKPLPVRDPARLFFVGETYQGSPSSMSAGNYTDANTSVTTFEHGLAAEQFSSFNLSEGGTPERVVGVRVTANFFNVMGATPALGRVFRPEEDGPGSEGVVVLSHRLWARRFGAAAAVVGRDVRMNGTRYTIVGVMPASFDLTSDSEELWVPIAFTPERKAMHDEHYLNVYGRLKPGATRAQALAELETVAVRLRHDFPKDASNLKYSMVPFVDQFVGDYRLRLFVLLGAVAVVLLIACGNVANLLLARGAALSREIAIRTALGAGRWRIVRQFMTESAVLALTAAALGVLLAKWSVAAVVAWSPPDVPRLDQAAIDPLALGFAVAIGLASSAMFGLAPAMRLSRTDVQPALREGARGSTAGAFRDRLRAGLVVAEVALSLLLLFGAGLLIRSALALQRVNPGFDPNGVLSARIALPATAYSDPARVIATFQEMAETTARIPGVTRAAVSSYAAMGRGGGTNGLLAEGEAFSLDKLISSVLRIITPGFFETMRIPILEGRNFDERDRTGGQKVMIVSQALAARAFPGQDPIGKRIVCCEPGPNGGPDYKLVVGVAGDVRSRGPATPPEPEFYLPLPQAPVDAWNWTQRNMYIVARTDGDPQRLVQPLRAAISRIDPDLPLFDVRMMNQRLAANLATARFNTLLLTILGGVGLVLAASGIYGVIAYLVSQRTQEIGVRIALGATQADVIRLIVAQALRPVALGAVIGSIAALAAGRVLQTQLFEVSSTDPITMAGVVAALMLVALAASVVPARRAASIDPTRALQAQ
jgi:putative ABC transport system permease protein